MPRPYLLAALTLLAPAIAPVPATAQNPAQRQPAQPAQPAQPDPRFLGTWQGPLRAGIQTLRLAFTIAADSTTHRLSGDMTSVDQGGVRTPMAISSRGDTLVVDLPPASIHYAGVLSAGGDSIKGTFTQGPAQFPLDLGRVAAITVATPPKRPQTPSAPFPYRAEQFSITSVPGVTLAGTLTIPAGKGPFPAVVFVTGSGPQDRDETLLGHKPFLVIADYLARHGIASLRYDDRGTAQSTGSFATGTSADFADDAEAAFRVLRARPEIAARHVGIIGHSEGGLIAPMVAARNRDVAFIVMMAGPGLRGDSILILQQKLIAMASGAAEADAAHAVANNGRLFAAMRGAKDSADADARARAAAKEIADAETPANRAILMKTFEMSLPSLLTPWMRAFMPYDPAPVLRKVTVPVLAMNGTLDLQVPYRENLPAIRAALAAAGNRDVKIVELPGLNHLFQTAATGSPAEYEKIEETVSPAALELIASWIMEHAQ